MAESSNKKNTGAKKIQKRSVESYQKIQEAARMLFVEKGYSNTNTKEIAKCAGVSVGNFYNYYKNKEEAYMDVMHTYVEGSEQALYDFSDKLLHIDNPRKGLEEYVKAQIERAQETGHLFDDCTIFIKENKELGQIFQAGEENIIRAIENVLRNTEGVKKRGDFSVMTRLVYSSVNEISKDIICCADSKFAKKYMEQFIVMLQNYIFGEE